MEGEEERSVYPLRPISLFPPRPPPSFPPIPFLCAMRYSCVSCKGPKEGSTGSGEPRFIEYQFPYEEIEPGKASLPFIRLYQPLFIDLVFHPRRSVRSIKALFIEFPPVNYLGIIPASNNALRKEFRFFSFFSPLFLFSNANNRPRFFEASLIFYWRKSKEYARILFFFI